mgnify:CR=1 FL=1
MKLLAYLIAIACSALAAVSLHADAQQPGTPAYNSQYLPAHGVGDTRREQLWGALARGAAGVLGWSVGATTESGASDEAVRDCASKGGRQL